jgi:hypothetical protein
LLEYLSALRLSQSFQPFFFEQRNSKKRAVLNDEIRKKQKKFLNFNKYRHEYIKNDKKCHFCEKKNLTVLDLVPILIRFGYGKEGNSPSKALRNPAPTALTALLKNPPKPLLQC